MLFSYDALEEGDRFGPLSIKKDLLLSYLLDNLRPYPFELAEMEDGKVVALLNAAEGDTAQLMDKLEGMRRELARAAQIDRSAAAPTAGCSTSPPKSSPRAAR